LGVNTQPKPRHSKWFQLWPRRKLLRLRPLTAANGRIYIYVEVPSLGTTRRLNSGAFHGKLNDLYERGLIARESVRAAMRLADDRRRQLR
jgi:hypothetical protein